MWLSLEAAGVHAKKTGRNASAIVATLFGGSENEIVEDLAVDGDGNIVVVGHTASSDFPTRSAAQSQPGGACAEEACTDAFVTKLTPDGERVIFSTYLGGSSGSVGSGLDYATGVATDLDDNIYVTGTTYSEDFPTTAGAFKPRMAPEDFVDAFVVKLDASGAIQYSTYLGGTMNLSDGTNGTDEGEAIATDEDGNAYVVGRTSNTDFPSLNPYQAVKSGKTDAFLTRFNASGQLTYSTFFGGEGVDGAGTITARDGVAHFGGETASTSFPTQQPAQEQHGGGFLDGFVAALDINSNTLLFSSYLGGDGPDVVADLSTTDGEQVFTVGRTRSRDFPITGDALDSTYSGSGDGFITAIKDSQWAYSSFLGGRKRDEAHSVGFDAQGRATISGITASPNFPIRDAVQQRLLGEIDGFVVALGRGNQSLRMASFIGGTSESTSPLGDAAYAVATYRNRIYVAGWSSSTDIPVINSLRQTPRDADAFVLGVTFTRSGCSILGGDGRDQMRGTATGDEMCGREGGDRLFGRDGNDVLRGGPGVDMCKGGRGVDRQIRC